MRSYDGPALDHSWQSISEAPYWQGEGETVDATDPEPQGQETTENVPVPDGGERPEVDAEGQTTLADFAGWSR